MIYCFLADGFEETEAIAPVDVLRRAGAELKTVGVTGEYVTGNHGVTVKADVGIDEIVLDERLEGVILPGGYNGTLNLEKDSRVQSAIDFAAENNRLVCAICAAPSILGHKGLLSGREAIAFPGFEKDLKGAKISEKHVVTDDNFITAKGAGVALEFGFAITASLYGKDKASEIKKTMQCHD